MRYTRQKTSFGKSFVVKKERRACQVELTVELPHVINASKRQSIPASIPSEVQLLLQPQLHELQLQLLQEVHEFVVQRLL